MTKEEKFYFDKIIRMLYELQSKIGNIEIPLKDDYLIKAESPQWRKG